MGWLPDGTPTLVRELLLAALLLAAFWGSAALMARIAGWHRLAARFPVPAQVAGERHRFVSAAIGRPVFPVRYRGCVRLVVAGNGLLVTLMPPLRFGAPAFFVPWPDVERVEERQRLGVATVTLHLRDEPARLTLRGAIAQRVLAAWRAARSGTER